MSDRNPPIRLIIAGAFSFRRIVGVNFQTVSLITVLWICLLVSLIVPILYLYWFTRRIGTQLRSVQYDTSGHLRGVSRYNEATRESISAWAEKHEDLVRKVGIINAENMEQIKAISAIIPIRLSPIHDLVVATAENFKLRMEDINSRLINIETENKTTAPVKRDEDDDPLSGSRSWSAQAAAASRALGADYIA